MKTLQAVREIELNIKHQIGELNNDSVCIDYGDEYEIFCIWGFKIPIKWGDLK